MNCSARKLLENERAMIKLVSNYLGKIEVLIRLFTNSISLSLFLSSFPLCPYL